MDKTITVKESVWKELTQLKLEWKCITLNDVLVRLLDEKLKDGLKWS